MTLSNDDGADEANAAFIVKAVNAHDELVAALSAAASIIESLANGGPSFVALNDQLPAIKAVLAKVTP